MFPRFPAFHSCFIASCMPVSLTYVFPAGFCQRRDINLFQLFSFVDGGWGGHGGYYSKRYLSCQQHLLFIVNKKNSNVNGV